MSLIFAGTPDFADAALSALLAAGHDVKLVLTRPDRPAGRGQQLQISPVKRRAQDAGIEVFQPRTLRDESARQVVAQVGADLMVVAAYGLILPAEVLILPRLGCLNIHASLLPRWRGAAPIQRAIEAGDRETGVTIMQMDEGLDTGAMLLTGRLPIAATDNATRVHDRLAELGASLIVQAVADALAGRLTPVPQPAEGVTYATKLDKAEAAIDWRLPASRLADRIRAFDPVPGSTARLIDRQAAQATPASPVLLKIWQAEAVSRPVGENSLPGTLLRVNDGELLVACGEGALRLLALQKPGGRRLPVRDFLRGFLVSEYCQFVVD